VQGTLRVETYDKGGETKISLACIADAILPLRAAPKERKAKAGEASRDRPEKPAADGDRLDRYGDDGSDRFHDDMPF